MSSAKKPCPPRCGSQMIIPDDENRSQSRVSSIANSKHIKACVSSGSRKSRKNSSLRDRSIRNSSMLQEAHRLQNSKRKSKKDSRQQSLRSGNSRSINRSLNSHVSHSRRSNNNRNSVHTRHINDGTVSSKHMTISPPKDLSSFD
jgi:hypothetical protein